MSSTVSFALELDPLDISMTLPGWNSNTSLASDASMSVGQVGHLGVSGTFMYFADVKPGNVDVLKIDLKVRHSQDSRSTLRMLILALSCYYVGSRSIIQSFRSDDPSPSSSSRELFRKFHQLFDPKRVCR